MSKNMVTYMVSFAGVVGLLKETYREQTAVMIANRHPHVPLMTEALNYNCVPYLTQLLEEIFTQGPDSHEDDNVPLSTRRLIADGLPKEIALPVAHQAYLLVIDALSLMVPNLSFGYLDRHQFGMCGEYDAMITPPFGHMLDPKEESVLF